MAKADIKANQLGPWDQYKEKQPDEIARAVHSHIEAASSQMCAWYWHSIRTKRKTSMWARGIAFLLLVIGTTLQLFASFGETAVDKLFMTQLAVAGLALAGLTQLADRVFGWSSGWMRYVATVTTMENLARGFQMDWGRYLVAMNDPLDIKDARALFDLARGFEQELARLQSDETTKWVAEFNANIALLESLIKIQRAEADKKLESIRTNLSEQGTAAKAVERATLPGALEVQLTFKSEPKLIKIALDQESPREFLGYSWTSLNLPPGQHVVRIVTTSQPPRTIERVADVKPDALCKLDIAVGE